ncbi:hypothetical protein H5410_027407 [Solanum commersonii]|uniref:Uncharacterized protein n=1 Tax=Solanum commersonii TaxID=4109 RepID=A0A9J5YZ24_SOLCO|nr:hypothetical protein H5410_027407 [Solanum commersonii]
MRAKSISTPATNASTMTALFQMSWVSAFVGDTLLCTNNQKNLAATFNMAFRIPNRGVETHSARFPYAAVYLANHSITVSRCSAFLWKAPLRMMSHLEWKHRRHRTPAQSPHYKSLGLEPCSTLVKVENSVNVGDSVQAPSEDSTLLCNNSGHLLFVINHLGIPIDLPLTLNTPSVWLIAHWSRVLIPWYWY